MVINWEKLETAAAKKYGRVKPIPKLCKDLGITRSHWYSARKRDSMSLKLLRQVAEHLKLSLSEVINEGEQTLENKDKESKTNDTRVRDSDILDAINYRLTVIERKLDELIEQPNNSTN